MTTLANLNKFQPGQGHWPSTAHNHKEMDVMFDVLDAEFNSSETIYMAFRRLQCCHSKPRGDAFRLFKEEASKGLRRNDFMYSEHQLECVAHALLSMWIENEKR
jgi:hypothetical protein